MDHVDQIKQFYNRNTARFLRWGDHHRTRSIHQPVWRQESFTKDQALHYPHELIISQINKLRGVDEEILHIADFGSGVGASVKYLSDHYPDDFFYAITISKAQNDIARNWLQRKKNIKCIEGNFINFNFNHELNCIFQIESFNHVLEREKLLKQIKKSLASKGYWIILDDFLTKEGLTSKWIDQYEKGWVLGKIEFLPKLMEHAASVGLELLHQQDLTPYLRLGRPRDKLIKVLNPLISQLAGVNHYARSWYGGLGRQESLRRGLISYRCVVFEKQ